MAQRSLTATMAICSRGPWSRASRALAAYASFGCVATRCRGQHLRSLSSSAAEAEPTTSSAAAGAGADKVVTVPATDSAAPFVGWDDSPTGGPTGAWVPLAAHLVADAEGDDLFTVSGNLDFCKTICSNYQGCRSFAYCESGAACYLKRGAVNATSAGHNNTFCITYYWTAETITTTSAPKPREPEPVCQSFAAKLALSPLQEHVGNPEADVRGTVNVFMCTNGTMLASLVLKDGLSDIIATHLYHCQGGLTPQKRTGALCSGTPVVNFCGSNGAGLIDDGAPYPQVCAGYDVATGISRNMAMPGRLVPALGLTVKELVLDMIKKPEMYYFNAHSLASYNYWHPDALGIARGVMEMISYPVTTTTLAPVDPDEVDTCYTLYSRLAMNELQAYRNNADAHASGYASFSLCANGKMSAMVLVFGGVSEIIATQIHKCEGGDTDGTRSAEMCQGPAVIAFCGENKPGYLDVGVEYSQACSPYSNLGASHTENIEGTVVTDRPDPNKTAELVMDIVRRPHQYFFNVHSLDSYGHWYPRHIGMCRGSMNVW